MKRAILIDDDPDDLQNLEEIIQTIDSTIKCHSFSDSVEALDYLAKNHEKPIDFVFTDFNMPKLNAIELIKELNSIKPNSDTVITVLSTTITDIVQPLRKVGVVNVFEKSANQAMFAGVIAAVLK